VTEPGGRRLAELAGTFSPDWERINGMLVEHVEPAAHVSGRPRPWRVSGPLAGRTATELLKSLDVELGLDLSEADIYGMHIGPAPLVVRSRRGALALDPIDATINGGTMHLEPEITVDDGQTRLRFGRSTSLRDAEINDEVSRRFLSYVAPILDRATRVHGRVSVALDEAVFPIGGEASKGATVEGQVVFHDVEFLPGPFADSLFDLVGREDRPGVKLDQPVALSIADRRVYQRGLAFPLGRVTRIELNGWVDFDRNLRMTASLPITPAMVGNAPVLSELVQGKRISVPIAGTLKDPKIDRDAISLALKDIGRTFLDNDAVRGAAEMLNRLRPRRDPDSPPPPTFRERMEQRKEQRQERRARRRGIEG
jgi:translocation and assembly module TamB